MSPNKKWKAWKRKGKWCLTVFIASLYMSFTCDTVWTGNRRIRGTQEVGMPTYTGTQRKEVCVCVCVCVEGEEGRVIKPRKLLEGMSCHVAHGRGLRAVTPRGGWNSKQLVVGKNVTRDKRDSTLFPSTTPPHSNMHRTAMYSWAGPCVQHTHFLQYRPPPPPSSPDSSCVVCFDADVQS